MLSCSAPFCELSKNVQTPNLSYFCIFQCIPSLCDVHQLLRDAADMQDWVLAASICLHLHQYSQVCLHIWLTRFHTSLYFIHRVDHGHIGRLCLCCRVMAARMSWVQVLNWSCWPFGILIGWLCCTENLLDFGPMKQLIKGHVGKIEFYPCKWRLKGWIGVIINTVGWLVSVTKFFKQTWQSSSTIFDRLQQNMINMIRYGCKQHIFQAVQFSVCSCFPLDINWWLYVEMLVIFMDNPSFLLFSLRLWVTTWWHCVKYTNMLRTFHHTFSLVLKSSNIISGMLLSSVMVLSVVFVEIWSWTSININPN